MPIIAKAGGGNFVPCPAGQHAAVCCDVVDMGVLEVTFGGRVKKQHKIRIVWQIEEVMSDNRPYIAQKRYTLSLHKKAALRADLESWRGRPFTDQELMGFDVENVIGVPALLNIQQIVKDGETYSNIMTLMKLPKGMTVLQVRDYTRVIDRAPEEGAGAGSRADADDPFGDLIDDADRVPF
jgi:hypothetical protein